VRLLGFVRWATRYNASVRRLIINADDFGLTEGVNRAIAEAHTHGIVSSATLMANASAMQDAVRRASQLPNLSVGCHVILVDGLPVLEPVQIPTLVRRGVEGMGFHESVAAFASRAVTGRLKPEQIEAEAVAQIRRLQSHGVDVSHLDTHKHTHMFPVVHRALVRAARTCGIRAMRNPFSPRVSLSLKSLRAGPRLWKRHLQVRGLGRLEEGFLRTVTEAGLLTPDGCLGVVATGALDLALFESAVDSIPAGTWEFVCHPGYADSELDKIKTRLKQSRAEELEILTSVEARRAVKRRGIELISYRELG
jgi:hopanoid biosynthesis associated protein HpnK